jgi:peptide/nickel transport system substrate-binding protein
MASHAGLEILTKPRDLALAKKLVAESGYAGEKVVMLSPSDRPVYSQMSQVARELFLKLGLNVDFQPMDWGSVVSRRASRNPVQQGGWSTFNTALDGITINNPGGNFALRGSGSKAWYGWTDDPQLEALRASWFDAPDLKSQKAVAEQVQLRALETVPYIPLGQIFQPTAARSEIRGFVTSPLALFWNVRRA